VGGALLAWWTGATLRRRRRAAAPAVAEDVADVIEAGFGESRDRR